MKLRIVGVVRIPAEAVLSFASSPLILSSPGWAAQHLAIGATPPTSRPAANGFFNALVRLKHGAADVPAFAADVARVLRPRRHPDQGPHRRHQAGAAIARRRAHRPPAVRRRRHPRRRGPDRAGVRPLGPRRLGDRAGAAGDGPRAATVSSVGLVAPHVVSIVVAAVTAVGSALAFSTRFPIGLGPRPRPRPRPPLQLDRARARVSSRPSPVPPGSAPSWPGSRCGGWPAQRHAGTQPAGRRGDAGGRLRSRPPSARAWRSSRRRAAPAPRPDRP